MQKIAVFGVHSGGKTTLAYALSAHFKMKSVNVKLIHESVRENCPFPINDRATQETCLWNFHKQFLNELEAEAQGYDLAICDRSVLDTFVYYHSIHEETAITKSALQQACQWLSTYDLLVRLEPPDGIELANDGIRSVDNEYLKLIKEGFHQIIHLHGAHVKDRIMTCSSPDIFEKDKRERLIQTIESQMEIDLKIPVVL